MELPGQQQHPDTSNGPEPSYHQQHQTYLQDNSTRQQRTAASLHTSTLQQQQQRTAASLHTSTLQQQGSSTVTAAPHTSAQQQQQLWRQFQHDWYTNNAMLAIDTTFYAVQGVSIALHRRIFGTAAQQVFFSTAILLSAGAFACCLFFKPVYRRVRAPVVLAMHLLLTVLRAAVFAAAASRQATLWRGPTLVVEEDHQVGPMLLAIVTVMAVPMRLFEVLGLQQTFAMHALVAVAFVALHPAAALQGAR
jgi:hypothetical protein